MSPTSDAERQKKARSGRTTVRGFLFRDKLPLETETCWFILVNVLDFFATYLLLRRGGREVNPVARWFLETWGLVKGLLAYKFLLVAFICVVTQIIALRRVETARKVLRFGIVVVGAVVLYSLILLGRAGGVL